VRYLQKRHVVSNKPIKEVYWNHPDRQPNPLISIPKNVFEVENKQNQNEGFINNESQISFHHLNRDRIKVNNEMILNETLNDKSKVFDQSKYEISKDVIRNLNNVRKNRIIPVKIDNSYTPKTRYKNLKETVIKIDVRN
jgi:hypothetical protein